MLPPSVSVRLVLSLYLVHVIKFLVFGVPHANAKDREDAVMDLVAHRRLASAFASSEAYVPILPPPRDQHSRDEVDHRPRHVDAVVRKAHQCEMYALSHLNDEGWRIWVELPALHQNKSRRVYELGRRGDHLDLHPVDR